MGKSEDSTHPPGQLLSAEEGHLVIPFVIDLPLRFSYNEETGSLVLDCPNLPIGNSEKAGILRLHFSPGALHSLVRSLHELEKSLGKEIGVPPKQSTQ